MTRLPTLDVIIVNWNAGALLRRCLEALSRARQESFRLERVIVVDNASTDGSATGLGDVDLPLTILTNDVNRGFAAACNRGAAASAADYLLFLNPDAYVNAESLSVPVAYLDAAEHQDIAVVGIQMRDHSGRISQSSARMPTAAIIAARIVGLDVLFPARVPSLFLTEWDHATTRQLDHVIGACYFIRRRVFESLNGFDERFFVYFEDLDLSKRVADGGGRIVYLASVFAEHTGGGTSDAIKARRLAYSLHSRIQFGYKHFGWAAATALAAGTLLIEPLPRLVRAVVRRSATEVRDTCLGFMYLWQRVLGFARDGHVAGRD
jgi:N-acetylglucosaminyl-diphospho-decaprenol L-rhamnosyltransferase